MGIRFYCPYGHKLNVKEFQAGQRGICPKCHARFDIPFESTRPAGSKDLPIAKEWEERARREGLFPFTKQAESVLDDIDLNHLPSSADAVPNAADAFASSGFTQAASGLGQQSAFDLSAPGASDPVQNLVQDPVQDLFQASDSPAMAVPPVQTPAAPRLPDPFEGPADTVWYVRPASGEQHGPIYRDTVQTWLRENRIAADTLVWREGWAEWKSACDVFESLAASKNIFGF